MHLKSSYRVALSRICNQTCKYKAEVIQNTPQQWLKLQNTFNKPLKSSTSNLEFSAESVGTTEINHLQTS